MTSNGMFKKEISVKYYLIKGGSSVVNMDRYNHVHDHQAWGGNWHTWGKRCRKSSTIAAVLGIEKVITKSLQCSVSHQFSIARKSFKG